MRSTRDQLMLSLTELQQFLLMLVQAVHVRSVNGTNLPYSAGDIVEQIIAKQEQIDQIVKEAEEREGMLKEIAVEKQEYQRLEGEISKLQKQFRTSQQMLEGVLSTMLERRMQTAQAMERQSSVRSLLSYAHLISSSFSTQMPPNWTEMDYRRPWPTDMDMRAGELGRLAQQSGKMSKLTEEMLAERQIQQSVPWKQQSVVSGTATIQTQILPLKQPLCSSSSSSEGEDNMLMEEVT